MLTRSFVVHKPVIRHCAVGKAFQFDYQPNGRNEGLPVGNAIASTATYKWENSLLPSHADAHTTMPLIEPNPYTCALNDSAKPIVVAIFERRMDGNHFHYGTLAPAFNAFTLCTDAAKQVGLSIDDVQCYPISTHTTIGRGNTHEALFEEELPQLRSFQNRLFGRAFLSPCTALEGVKVLAITFGETVNPIANFPYISKRYLRRKYPNANADTATRLRCAQLTNATIHDIYSSACHGLLPWQQVHGQSTDLPMYPELKATVSAVQARMVGPETTAPVSTRVILFQRTGCPFPDSWGKDNTAYRITMNHPHSRRCLVNIDAISSNLTAAGFEVTIVDFAEPHWHDYAKVIELMQSVSIFVGVEGSGSVHAMWLPKNRGAFVQLHPKRQGGWGDDNVDLYTEAWTLHSGVCTINWRLSDIHATPIDPHQLAAVVNQTYYRLLHNECRTCMVDSKAEAWRHHVTPGVAGIWAIQDRANQVPYHGPHQELVK